MNPTEAKRREDVKAAFQLGAKIEVKHQRFPEFPWCEVTKPSWDWITYDYRVAEQQKPEPKQTTFQQWEQSASAMAIHKGQVHSVKVGRLLNEYANAAWDASAANGYPVDFSMKLIDQLTRERDEARRELEQMTKAHSHLAGSYRTTADERDKLRAELNEAQKHILEWSVTSQRWEAKSESLDRQLSALKSPTTRAGQIANAIRDGKHVILAALVHQGFIKEFDVIPDQCRIQEDADALKSQKGGDAACPTQEQENIQSAISSPSPSHGVTGQREGVPTTLEYTWLAPDPSGFNCPKCNKAIYDGQRVVEPTPKRVIHVACWKSQREGVPTSATREPKSDEVRKVEESYMEHLSVAYKERDTLRQQLERERELVAETVQRLSQQLADAQAEGVKMKHQLDGMMKHEDDALRLAREAQAEVKRLEASLLDVAQAAVKEKQRAGASQATVERLRAALEVVRKEHFCCRPLIDAALASITAP